jgi:hypothetical protein
MLHNGVRPKVLLEIVKILHLMLLRSGEDWVQNHDLTLREYLKNDVVNSTIFSGLS